MNRDHQFDFDFPDEQRRPEADAGVGGRAGGGGNAAAGPDTNDRDRERDDRDRRQLPGLSDKEARVLRVVGAFRAVDHEHLPPGTVDKLIRKGLAKSITAQLRQDEPRREIVSLTPKGRKLAASNPAPGSRQRYYSGIVKPRELRHDLAIYPAFVKEMKAIEARGGKLARVVMDHELKSIMAKRMNAAPAGHAGGVYRVDEEIKAERRLSLASELELPIVDEHLKIPDARIEYEDEHGQYKHIDLEITTEQYRGKMMSGKRAAGFKLSSVKESSGPRGKVRDDHHHNFC